MHLRPRLARDLRLDARLPRAGHASAARRASCGGSSTCSTSATTSTSTAARSACAATWSRSSRSTRTSARCASSSSATRSRASPRSTRCAARCCRGRSSAMLYPASHYVATDATLERAIAGHPRRAAGAPRSASAGRTSCSRRSASSSARSTTSRCSRRWASATASRTTRAGSTAAAPASRRYTLFDYFPDDLLVVLDESHVTVPQIGGMYRGDRARKETLVEYGFRLPSALDNRPLRFEEWESRARRSASTSRRRPAEYELERSQGVVVEQIIRPTGLVDPAGRGAAGRGAGRRPARRDPQARRRAASACWSRRSPSAWPRS